MSIKNNMVTGNLSVSKDITAGGGVNARGDSVFNKNLRVEGWLDAPNIRGAYKGLFKTSDSLKKKYPSPQLGWWALVGETLPANIYMVGNTSGKLEWEDTENKTTGLELDAGIFSENIEELYELIDQEKTEREDADSTLDSAIKTETALRKNDDKILRERINEEVFSRTTADGLLQEQIDEVKNEMSAPIYFNIGTLYGSSNSELFKSKDVPSFFRSIVSRGEKGILTGRIGNSLGRFPLDNVYFDGVYYRYSYFINDTLYAFKVDGEKIIVDKEIRLSSSLSGSAPMPIVEVTPSSGEANTKTIKTTTLKFRNPIVSYDVENIKMIHPNGVAFLGYGGGTYSINGNTMVINWNFDAVEGEYELRIPNGAFVIENDVVTAINEKYNVTLAPVEYFTPNVNPVAGNVTTSQIKKMTITFPSPIETFNGSDVRFAKNFGSVWYDYAAEGTISEDRLSMTIDWDFAPEVGLKYTLELPKGCITLENGDKNTETKVEYVIT